MKVQHKRRLQRWRKTWYAVFLSMLCATSMTWLIAIFDHPVDDAIVAGMMSPECAKVGRMPPGSVLFATLPDGEICRSFFLYRATAQNAASDAPAYQSMIMQERVGEFWRMIGYVLLLWLMVTAVVAGFAGLIRRLFARRSHRL